eukprot:g7301.t1
MPNCCAGRCCRRCWWILKALGGHRFLCVNILISIFFPNITGGAIRQTVICISCYLLLGFLETGHNVGFRL